MSSRVLASSGKDRLIIDCRIYIAQRKQCFLVGVRLEIQNVTNDKILKKYKCRIQTFLKTLLKIGLVLSYLQVYYEQN